MFLAKKSHLKCSNSFSDHTILQENNCNTFVRCFVNIDLVLQCLSALRGSLLYKVRKKNSECLKKKFLSMLRNLLKR